MTRIVDSSTSCLPGQVHFAISSMEVLMNDLIPANSFVMVYAFPSLSFISWQGLRASNSRPAVLETAALPTELNPCIFSVSKRSESINPDQFTWFLYEPCVCGRTYNIFSFRADPECFFSPWSSCNFYACIRCIPM